MNGNELDKLTHNLLKVAAEKPSANLSFRIMERIDQEIPPVKKQLARVRMETWKISPLLIVGTVIYIICTACLLISIYNKPAIISFEIFERIKDELPYILTATGIIGAIPFFSILDKALSFGR